VTDPLPSIAIVSTVLPPAPSGQARVLGHLLGDPPPGNLVLLTEHWPFFSQHAESNGKFANYRKFRQLRIQWQENGWLERFSPRCNAFAGVLRSVFERAREVAAAVTEFHSAAIVACSGSPFDLPACTLAAFWSRVPLVAYLFDDPIFQWPPGPMRSFARVWEPIWGRTATQIIAPNEAMAKEFFRRRGRQPTIVRNPVSPEAFSDADQPWPAFKGSFRVVYTGSIYHAQSDAFINLLGALNDMKDWSLHIYTSQNEAQLANMGISGPNVFRHEHVEQLESYAQQRSADILFLPLAFKSSIQEVLRTSAPMKLGEYLASGRPILVHAPADTFVARHFRQHGAGVVVDSPDRRILANALSEIAANPALRDSLRVSARALAGLYSVGHARKTFRHVVTAAITA
jgi:glycosyltransferase involved in cell wall biosynthesis